MRFSWDKLRIFYLTACAGSINRAAELQNKTSPAVSASIRSLEKELGIKLFNRLESGLSLTIEGEHLLLTAEKVYNMLRSETEWQNNRRGHNMDHIKTLAPSSILTRYIETFIDKFIIANPHTRMTLLSSDGLSLAEKLNTDILISPYIENLTGYVQEPLISLTLRLYASKGYLEKHGKPESPEDLDKHQLVAYSIYGNRPDDLNWHLHIGRPKNNPRKAYMDIDAHLKRCYICSKDVGIISVPPQHPDLKKYDLVPVLPELAGPTNTYFIICEENIAGYEKNKKLISFYKDAFSAL
ncbi:MAG: hypothetical protein C0514_08185 [Candidatus Puniceispirillum sp.]|nr:hypothetical protein [Candidatus Puniceispirillum sp.]